MAENEAKPRYFRRFLKGTYHYASAGIPEKFPLSLRLFAKLFFSKMEVPETDLEKIRRQTKRGVIVYALPNALRLECLLVAFRLRMLGLPVPVFSHYISLYMIQPLTDTLRRIVAVLVSLFSERRYPNPYRNGYVKQILKDGKPTILFLRQFRGLPRRFFREHMDPLASILQASMELDRELIIVPLFVLYSKQPMRETFTVADMFLGSREEPGRLRMFYTLVRNYKKLVLRVGKTIRVDQFIESKTMKVAYSTERMQEMAYLLRREALNRIETERRVAIGPALKHRSEIIEDALQAPETRRKIHEYTAEKDLPYSKGRRLVRSYLEEIAAGPNSLAILFLDRLVTWFLKRNYSALKVDEEGLEHVRKISRHMPVVYVPTHKSHMDYLLVSHALYHRHISLPFIAAGVNLKFWPLGPIFRGCGAFFLRRSFKGAPLYPFVFAKYVEILLKESSNLEFFIEGGRSRTGKLGVPKLGFLSIVLDAALKAGLKDLCFAPVMITYERVLEDAYYFREQSGEPKPPENLSSMIKGRRILGRKQGAVYLDFAEPISLRKFLDELEIPEIPEDRKESMELASRLARMIIGEMNRISKVPPYSLVAATVLSTEKRGIYMETVTRHTDILVDYLRRREIPFTENVGTSHFWPDPVLATMESEGVIRSDHGEKGEDTLYFVDETKRLNLCFYKNAIVHHFQFPALLAMALLRKQPVEEADLRGEYGVLRSIMRREFFYGHNPDQLDLPGMPDFTMALDYFMDAGFTQRLEGRIILTSAGRDAARLHASMVFSFLESYFLTFRAVRRMGKKPVPEKEIQRRTVKMADRLFSTGEIGRKESKNILIFETALGFLQAEGILALDVKPIKRGKRFERTYQLKDPERLDELLKKLTPFLDAAR